MILWIGAANVSAVAHYDHAHNAYVQVQGYKRFILAPPAASLSMYQHPAPSHSHRQSRILDLSSVNASEFPMFKDAPLQAVTVGPGDVLYIPPLWFHNVKALTTSISVSVWSYPSPLRMQSAGSQPHRGDHSCASFASYQATKARAAWRSFDVIMETKQAAALQLMRSWIMETHSNDLAAATRFLERLLESKYQSSRSVRSKWCTAKVQQCPSAKFSLGRHGKVSSMRRPRVAPACCSQEAYLARSLSRSPF